jgi:hypothetical protein
MDSFEMVQYQLVELDGKMYQITVRTTLQPMPEPPDLSSLPTLGRTSDE